MHDPDASLSVARELAWALANADIDPNEVARIATYARIHRDGARVFRLLETLDSRDGQFLVRSGQTRRYFREIRAACGGILAGYRTAIGERADELAWILGWAFRLLRYYNTPVGQAELAEAQRSGRLPRSCSAEERRPEPSGSAGAQTAALPRREPERLLPPPAPVVRPETRRERLVLTSKGKSGKAQAQTEDGKVVTVTSLPAFPTPGPGDQCRAEVTREGGKPTRAVFKGWLE